MWNRWLEHPIPHPIGVSEAEYMAWYEPRTVTLLNEEPPTTGDAAILEAAVIHPPHFEPHGNTTQLLVSILYILNISLNLFDGLLTQNFCLFYSIGV
jgi:hypothetical protein